MSDDPASIEAWQEEEKGDLVARLRVINHHTKKLAENEGLHYVHREAFTRCEDLTWEAANEIERLRAEIDRKNLTIQALTEERDEVVRMANKLTDERDEARREVCVLMQRTGFLRGDYAAERGWDCFKENT
ncbi:hypothetical protein UFOVP403_9 [uncultured Caudovirales phage]|uniref:Uncharacterized protein n=1 Tax=uncultured Caudovirales phage TaxID=2100421 RepID=A0A6J5M5A9_9CAUD|nr:hypothetical protein UFOVP403_9 [uncultured Caudovirales phage]